MNEAISHVEPNTLQLYLCFLFAVYIPTNQRVEARASDSLTLNRSYK
jgi:hypothetical protein